MKHYGMPDKLVRIIQNMYQGATCRVVHCGQLSEAFELLTGGKQGCQLTPIMFLMLIDWIMRKTTNGRRMGIQWTMWDHLEDLDFANDIALQLSHRFQQIQEKTTRLETIAAGTGLRINGTKTKMMRIKNENVNGVSLMSGPIEEVSEFTYLGSVVSKTGGTEQNRTLLPQAKYLWQAARIANMAIYAGCP